MPSREVIERERIRREAAMAHPDWSEYRYSLTRDLDPEGPEPKMRMCWVMLNPSTATEVHDDATIRRVKGFTLRHGFSQLIVVNLFALRATKPTALTFHEDPVGPRNIAAIKDAFATSVEVVFAWGAWQMGPLQPPDVLAMAHEVGHTPRCLGYTKGGSPRHPLYVPASTRLEPYRPGGPGA